jgi:hypothetical protein
MPAFDAIADTRFIIGAIFDIVFQLIIIYFCHMMPLLALPRHAG